MSESLELMVFETQNAVKIFTGGGMEAATAKREADKKLRAKIRGEIIADLVTLNITGSVEGIADAILAGCVRHVRVVF